MTTRPPMSRKAPVTNGHAEFAPKSDTSVRMSDARAAAVTVTMKKNGPSARANMRVLFCCCCEELICYTSVGCLAFVTTTGGLSYSGRIYPTRTSDHLTQAPREGLKSIAFATFVVNRTALEPFPPTGTCGFTA